MIFILTQLGWIFLEGWLLKLFMNFPHTCHLMASVYDVGSTRISTKWSFLLDLVPFGLAVNENRVIANAHTAFGLTSWSCKYFIHSIELLIKIFYWFGDFSFPDTSWTNFIFVSLFDDSVHYTVTKNNICVECMIMIFLLDYGIVPKV